MSQAQMSSTLVEPFYDKDTGTFSYVAYDQVGGMAVIIDPVLDYEPAGARISTASADALLEFVRSNLLTVARLVPSCSATSAWVASSS